MNLKNKNVYIFSPKFFGYDLAIKEQIESFGAEVNLFDERPFNGFIGKSMLRLNFKYIISYCVTKYFENILLPNIDNIDYLILVSPESISVDTLLEIKKINKKIKIITYMWDSFDNKKQAKKLIDLSDFFFTFDPLDSENYNVELLPLFYLPDYEDLGDLSEVKYECSFIGTAHSDRYNVLKKITNRVENKFLFLYTPYKLVFLYKKYIAKELKGLSLKDVSSCPLSRNVVVNIIKNSKSVIDINHPSQVGLTMRTIEVLGSKRKLITTNKEIKKYDFYNENNIFYYNDKLNNQDDMLKLFLNKPFIEIDQDIYRKYSLNNWVQCLFKLS